MLEPEWKGSLETVGLPVCEDLEKSCWGNTCFLQRWEGYTHSVTSRQHTPPAFALGQNPRTFRDTQLCSSQSQICFRKEGSSWREKGNLILFIHLSLRGPGGGAVSRPAAAPLRGGRWRAGGFPLWALPFGSFPRLFPCKRGNLALCRKPQAVLEAFSPGAVSRGKAQRVWPLPLGSVCLFHFFSPPPPAPKAGLRKLLSQVWKCCGFVFLHRLKSAHLQTTSK